VVGEHEPYQPASDVYSFGLMLWELIHCRIVLAHLTPVQAALLRLQLDAASQPQFAREAPPDGHGPFGACVNIPPCMPPGQAPNSANSGSEVILSCTSRGLVHFSGGSHHTAKLPDNAPFIPHVLPHRLGSSRGSAGMRDDSVGPNVGDCTSGTELASALPMLKHEADRHADCDTPAEAGATESMIHGCCQPAIDADQWNAIVELVRQCWEWELEARPSAASLEAQLRASVASVAASAEDRAEGMPELVSPSEQEA
jgi:hypothetical protein